MTLNRWNSYNDRGRVCTKCSAYLPWDHFHKHSICPHGRNTVCKQCRKPASSKHYKSLTSKRKLYDRAKARAASKGLEFNISLDDVIVPALCPVLGVKMAANTGTAPSLDRIDSSKGYIRGNVAVISTRANYLKGNATVEELQKVLDYMKGACELV